MSAAGTGATPESFARAHAGLESLVSRVRRGEVPGAGLLEEADRWRREDCAGARTLSEAAALAMRYEIGLRGMSGDDSGARSRLQALGAIENTVERPGAGQHPGGAPAPVALPEAERLRHPDRRGYRAGDLEIQVEGSGGEAHASVAHPRRFPRVEEMVPAVRQLLPDPGADLWAWLPPSLGERGFLVHLFVGSPPPRP